MLHVLYIFSAGSLKVMLSRQRLFLTIFFFSSTMALVTRRFMRHLCTFFFYCYFVFFCLLQLLEVPLLLLLYYFDAVAALAKRLSQLLPCRRRTQPKQISLAACKMCENFMWLTYRGWGSCPHSPRPPVPFSVIFPTLSSYKELPCHMWQARTHTQLMHLCSELKGDCTPATHSSGWHTLLAWQTPYLKPYSHQLHHPLPPSFPASCGRMCVHNFIGAFWSMARNGVWV